MRIFLIALLTLAFGPTGCARAEPDNGLILTSEGRLVRETDEVARSEFARVLAGKSAEAAGEHWTSLVVIRELPILHLARADEWGWAHLTVDLSLTPPAGITDPAAAVARAETVVRDTAAYRVRHPADVTVITVVRDAGAAPAGSLTYTTVAGDTFAKISAAFYGTPLEWHRIADQNPGVDPGNLTPGTALVIPPKP